MLSNHNYASSSVFVCCDCFLIQNCFIPQEGNLETLYRTSSSVMRVLHYVIHTWLKSNKVILKYRKYPVQIAFSPKGKGLWFPMGYMTLMGLFVFLNSIICLNTSLNQTREKNLYTFCAIFMRVMLNAEKIYSRMKEQCSGMSY